MIPVTYRLFNPRWSPRRIRAATPGWAGEKVPRADGAHEQPWHCLPFMEAAQSGLEIFYPYDNELHVSRDTDQKLVLAGDFGPHPGGDLQWPPFRSFGENFYSCQLLLDLAVPPGYAVRTAPHPRYFTQESVPLAVPALLRTEWWPMIAFLIFRTPPPGVTHIFRPGEPFVQFLIEPTDTQIALEPMAPEQAAERELRSRRIHASRATLAADTTWTSSTNTVFDGTYRHLLGAAKTLKTND